MEGRKKRKKSLLSSASCASHLAAPLWAFSQILAKSDVWDSGFQSGESTVLDVRFQTMSFRERQSVGTAVRLLWRTAVKDQAQSRAFYSFPDSLPTFALALSSWKPLPISTLPTLALCLSPILRPLNLPNLTLPRFLPTHPARAALLLFLIRSWFWPHQSLLHSVPQVHAPPHKPRSSCWGGVNISESKKPLRLHYRHTRPQRRPPSPHEVLAHRQQRNGDDDFVDTPLLQRPDAHRGNRVEGGTILDNRWATVPITACVPLPHWPDEYPGQNLESNVW